MRVFFVSEIVEKNFFVLFLKIIDYILFNYVKNRGNN